MKEKSWIVFLTLGILILGFSLNSLINIPLFMADDHWDWLTGDGEVIEYIRFYFLVQGAWQLGFALLVIITAVTGYRQGQQWAWYALWVVPLLLIGLSAIMFWLLPVTVVLIVVAVGALLVSRPIFFQQQAQPVVK